MMSFPQHPLCPLFLSAGTFQYSFQRPLFSLNTTCPLSASPPTIGRSLSSVSTHFPFSKHLLSRRFGVPQPDNREGVTGGSNESCLAVLNNHYDDGVRWHDVACHHRKHWVCEDSRELLDFVRSTNPHLRL